MFSKILTCNLKGLRSEAGKLTSVSAVRRLVSMSERSSMWTVDLVLLNDGEPVSNLE